MEPKVLLAALKSAVAQCSAGEMVVGVSYSGGLDSSLIAELASEHGQVICYSCATVESHDAQRVREYAEADGFDVRLFELTERDMPSLVARAAGGIRSEDPIKIAYTIPTLVVMERCDQSVLLAGNGADELFGGYEKYLRQPEGRESRMRKDLCKSIDEAEALRQHGLRLGKRLFFPYLQDEIVALGLDIPINQKISKGSRKAILREAGMLAGLSAADRPKKAAQYSSGTLTMMRALARREGATLSDWTRSTASGCQLGKD